MRFSITSWLSSGSSRYRHLVQRRIRATDHLHPQRWNWQAIINPPSRSKAQPTAEPVTPETKLALHHFLFHGLYNAVVDAFYLSFIPLFALAYGASNGQVGWLTAIANLLGAAALFPGARVVERLGRRKPVVIWSLGGASRVTLLILGLLPWFGLDPIVAIIAIIGLNGLRAFMDNFSSPAWTALVADIVPASMRARYFSRRNIVMGIATLTVAPLAGWLVTTANAGQALPVRGYQLVFLLAFGVSLFSTLSFQRIPEPESTVQSRQKHQRGDMRRALKGNPIFLGLVITAFVWNMAIQIGGPFFNIYLVNNLGGTVAMVGWFAGITSLSSLVGQRIFSRLADKKSLLWVQQVSGFLIPGLPLAWMLVTAPWQVFFISIYGGLVWSGYNLANFNMLLELSPQEQRPRAVALYQTAVFGSAIVGPLIGGYLADLVSFQLIFGISGVGRALAMVIFTWLVARPLRRSGGPLVMPTESQ